MKDETQKLVVRDCEVVNKLTCVKASCSAEVDATRAISGRPGGGASSRGGCSLRGGNSLNKMDNLLVKVCNIS